MLMYVRTIWAFNFNRFTLILLFVLTLSRILFPFVFLTVIYHILMDRLIAYLIRFLYWCCSQFANFICALIHAQK